MPKASFMTPLGHFEAHMPQETQRLSSMTGWLSSSLMAPMGQFFTHIPQAMQPASQTLRVSGPLSRLLHETTMFCSAGTRRIMPCGQALTHSPQPMHFDLSTSATPFAPTLMAPSLHAAAQLPSP